MPREIISFQQFLKVIGQTDRIEFDYVPLELLNPARVDISVRVLLNRM